MSKQISQLSSLRYHLLCKTPDLPGMCIPVRALAQMGLSRGRRAGGWLQNPDSKT
jgi:hypothetical protein